MGERGPSPLEQPMSRREFLIKSSKLATVGTGLVMGLRGDRSATETKKEITPQPETPEREPAELFQRLFAEIPEPKDLFIKDLIKLEKAKLKTDFKERLKAAAPYLPHAMEIFRQEGVPAQLALLALPESGFEFKAKSHRQAHGPFQFTEATAKSFGLTVSPKIDERRDPFLASRAAARLLKNLRDNGQRIDSWEKAIQAYHSGMASRFEDDWKEYIKHVMQERNSIDAFTQSSAKERLNYLPRFFATRQLFQEHLTDAGRLEAPVIATQYQFHLSETRPSQTYTVKKGEKLFRIARYLGVTEENLRRWNKIDNPRHLQAGQTLQYHLGETHHPRPSELAAQAGMTPEQLAQANPSWADRLIIKDEQLPPDFPLTLPGEKSPRSGTRLHEIAEGAKKTHYRLPSTDFRENVKKILETGPKK